MAEQEVEFADGLFVNKPRDNAPDFVKADISINAREFYKWLGEKGKTLEGDEKYIRFQVKEGKSGKWYASVDNWKPKAAKEESFGFDDDSESEDVPF